MGKKLHKEKWYKVAKKLAAVSLVFMFLFTAMTEPNTSADPVGDAGGNETIVEPVAPPEEGGGEIVLPEEPGSEEGGEVVPGEGAEAGGNGNEVQKPGGSASEEEQDDEDESSTIGIDDILKGNGEEEDENNDQPLVNGTGNELPEVPLGDPPIVLDNVFYVTFWDGNVEHAKREVAAGTTVGEPTPPEPPSGMKSFLGWFYADGTEFVFSTPITQDIDLYAKFSPNHLVRFVVNGVVMHSQEVVVNNYMMPEYDPPAPEGQRLMHWYIEGTANPEEDAFDFENTRINENYVLVAYFSDSVFVYFVSHGSYVATQQVKIGETADEPATPSREGFTFDSWTLTDGSRDKFNFNTPIYQDTYLYGVWNGKAVNYTVVYWLETANQENFDKDKDSHYSYAYSETKTAIAGTTETVDATKVVTAGKTYANWPVEGLKYSQFERGGSAEIDGRGTTIINVFYTRLSYTFTFNLNATGSKMIIGGQEYVYPNHYTITAKYQEDIGERWPTVELDGPRPVEIIRSGYSAAGWDVLQTTTSVGVDTARWVSRRPTLTEQMLATNWQQHRSYEMRTYWTANANLLYVNYMFESLDPDGAEARGGIKYPNTSNGKWYEFDATYSQYAYLSSTSNSLNPKEIESMEAIDVKLYKKNAAGDWDTDINNAWRDARGARHQYILYNRKHYTFTLNAMGGTLADVGGSVYPKDLPYQSTIPEPNPPLQKGYTFIGWYTDADFYEKFDFAGATMPSHDLTLFAKWEPDEVKVEFFTGLNGTKVGERGAVVGGTISGPPDGYDWKLNENVDPYGAFKGWYYYVGGALVQFRWETYVYTDMKIYAQWQTEDYTIAYEHGDVAGTVTGTLPTDDSKYARNVLAPVADVGDLQHTLGNVVYQAIGWQLEGNGRTYYPGNTVNMVNNVTFKAKYRDQTGDYIQVKFNPNGGQGSAFTWDVDRNANFYMPGATAFTRPGFALKGWSTAPTGGTVYDNDILYTGSTASDLEFWAVWERVAYEVTIYHVDLNGDPLPKNGYIPGDPTSGYIAENPTTYYVSTDIWAIPDVVVKQHTASFYKFDQSGDKRYSMNQNVDFNTAPAIADGEYEIYVYYVSTILNVTVPSTIKFYSYHTDYGTVHSPTYSFVNNSESAVKVSYDALYTTGTKETETGTEVLSSDGMRFVQTLSQDHDIYLTLSGSDGFAGTELPGAPNAGLWPNPNSPQRLSLGVLKGSTYGGGSTTDTGSITVGGRWRGPIPTQAKTPRVAFSFHIAPADVADDDL